MNSPSWEPDDLPLDKPNPARMYDYFLGGYHNFEIDRQAAEQVIAVYPYTTQVMRANRAFLRRAVTFLGGHGINQFLDIGSGIPTVGNVHEIAQHSDPTARVVYVDVDPIAVAHSEAILRNVPNTAVIQADARQTEHILAHPHVQRLLDFNRPIGVLLVAVLHFVTGDEDAYGLVRKLRAALPSGSYFVISHGTHESVRPEERQKVEDLYARSTNPIKARSWAQIERFFEDLELVEPGLVYVPRWWPEGPEDLFMDRPEASGIYAGVARKP